MISLAPRQSRSVHPFIAGFAVLLLAALLSACAGRGGPVPYDPPGFTAPDPLADKLPELPAILAPGDTLTINVFKVDSLSGDQAIDTAGRIKLPLIGAVVAAGLTTDQLERDIAARLEPRFLVAPDVRVLLKTPMQRTVAVDGSVMQPGLYPVAGQTTLIQTVAMARGTAEGANTHRVVVFRTIQGQRMAASFDLDSIRKGEMADPAVYAGDIVVVDGSALSSAWKLLLQALPFVALFRPFG